MPTQARFDSQAERRLRRKLEQMPETVRAAMAGALEQGANEIADMARRLAPRRDNVLADSIEVKPSEQARRRGRFGSGETLTATRGSVKAEFGLSWMVSVSARHAKHLEFGTVKMTAQPYFFPSYRALKRRAKSRVSRAMGRAIRELAQQ